MDRDLWVAMERACEAALELSARTDQHDAVCIPRVEWENLQIALDALKMAASKVNLDTIS